jgi:hypothetical protein
MDQFVVDITGIRCEKDDEVVLVGGRDEQIRAESGQTGGRSTTVTICCPGVGFIISVSVAFFE